MPTPSIANYHNMLCRSTRGNTYTEYYLLYLHQNLIILLNFSPFESPKGLNTNILFPNTSRYIGSLEGQCILRRGLMYWFNNFAPIKFIDHVEFSALLMVEIILAKNWCAK